MTLAFHNMRDSTSFSCAPTPLHSAAAGTHKQQQPKTVRPAHAPFHCATLRKTAETREHWRRESGQLPAPVPRKNQTQRSTYAELSALTTAPKS